VDDGWQSTTYMTSSMELTAPKPAKIQLGPVQFIVYRGASIAYTPDRNTRVTSSATIIICPS
jgi:hypothetical protein